MSNIYKLSYSSDYIFCNSGPNFFPATMGPVTRGPRSDAHADQSITILSTILTENELPSDSDILPSFCSETSRIQTNVGVDIGSALELEGVLQ